MMTIKINIIKGIWILFCLFIFFESCNNKDKLVGEYYLSDEMKQTVPFDGSETITFIDGEDTIVFDRGERNIFIPTLRISPNEYTYGEYDDTKFITNDGKYNILFFLQTTYYNSYPGRGKIIWEEIEDNILKSKGLFLFNIPLSTATLDQGQWFLDEMEIRGVNYTNVYCDSVSFDGGYTWPKEPKTVYYTKESGIIKIEFTQGNTWELLKIDWN
jgi:hypothetical protein